MSENHGPYHRRGEPGGIGCQVAALPITIKGPDGSPIPAQLLDAGKNATELELLRTIAAGLGVRWGHDEFGWWAVVAAAQNSDTSKVV
jgi:hypothetical protein